MQIIGFILGILIGLSLGLIGSGGSILTIPILVYILNITPSNATTYSLFIVGISALVGSIKGAKDKLLDFKMAVYFGLPSIISIFIMRKFLVPLLPNILFEIAGFTVSKDFFIMFVFAVLMILASFSMIKKTNLIENDNYKIDLKSIILKGIFIGVLTGFVGVGGGFLIIPTLLFSARLTMKKAVATSLVVIAFNSLIGFAGSINNTVIEWAFLLEFTAFSIVGIFVGILLSKKISNEKLKPVFGWFVLITGIYIIIKEIFLK
jgi:uncharacterized membrane protein YfcA